MHDRIDASDTDATATAHVTQPIWALEPCPTWCDPTTHDGGDHPGDRMHCSRELETAMTLPVMADMGIDEPASSRWRRPTLFVELRQSYLGGREWLHFWSDNVAPRISFDLTREEAGALLEAVDMLEELAKGGEQS